MEYKKSTETYYKSKSPYIRGYRLYDGDIFTIPLKRWFDVFSCSNMYYVFVLLKVYKNIIWYRPTTWFKKMCDVKFIEIQNNI